MTDITPALDGIGLLVLEPCIDGGVIVHALGPTYSTPPTCREALDAVHSWMQKVDRQKMLAVGSLTKQEFDGAGPHLRSFLSEIDAHYFWHRQMPTVVAVPGEGHWTYVKNSAAVQLLPQDRRDYSDQGEPGNPTKIP